MIEAQELDSFLRMAHTALSASFHGVHKNLEREQALKHGHDLALKMWVAIIPMKPAQLAEQWASFKIDVVAFAANMMAHNKDLADNVIIADAIECAKIKWRMHLAWRNKGATNDNKDSQTT